MNAAKRDTSYGSVVPSRREYQWMAYGYPWALFITVGTTAGRQFIALIVIIIQVFMNSHHLMNCDSRQVGVPISCVCEYTKAYVRCFPLLAMVVSLIVSSRILLLYRVYYEMLKRDVLVDFDNFSPQHDPLFLLLLWCFANAVAHFLLHIWRAHDISKDLGHIASESLIADVNEISVFYLTPALLFLYMLFSAYDTEERLVPLSKYFEEDPDAARRALSTMPFVPEAAAATVVHKGLTVTEPWTLDAAIAELTDAAALPPGDQDHAASGRDKNLEVQPLSNWRLVDTMWPAKLLLDHRLSDDDSAAFRIVWYIFSFSSFALMVFVFFFFAKQTLKDVKDVFHRQYTDACSLGVLLGHAIVTFWLAYCFLKNALVPFRRLELYLDASKSFSGVV